MRLALSTLALLLLVACGRGDADPVLSPTATASPTPLTTASPSPLPAPTATPSPVPTASPRAVASVPLVFLPTDDGPHADVNTEWWYYSGHLRDGEGNRFAFHYVVFKLVFPGLFTGYIAHIAIADFQSGLFATDQRVLPGPGAEPAAEGFSFDLDGWTLSGFDGIDSLSASTGGRLLSLDLRAAKPAVLHGGNGLVDFGPGAESYYYSRTRLSATGTIAADHQSVPVSGQAWFDHQWGNFIIQALGWDWFSIQLDDGTDIMLSVLRDAVGRPLHRYGTIVAADGRVTTISAEGFTVIPRGTWTSPVNGAEYPMGWEVRLPDLELVVSLVAANHGSEFDSTATTGNYYWEGAVVVDGTHSGLGFVEMTGYASLRIPSQ